MPSKTLRVSKRNSAFQVLESLGSNRQQRHKNRSFLVEGVQPINTALEHRWEFEALIYEGGTVLSGWASHVLKRASPALIYEVSKELLAQLSGKVETSELLAVLKMPEEDLGRIPHRKDLLVVVMDRPSNPGNLGTLIRSCDAFGVDGLIVTGHGVDPYDRATITASRGSLFAVPVVHLNSHAEVSRWVGAVRQSLGECQVVGADESAALELCQHDLVPPTVAVFGNEATGLSRGYRQLCDAVVRIPMGGSATSLNVSVAASIVLYEAGRQRRSLPDP